MNEIRLICLDMDGTLLDDDHATVPQRNLRALRTAAERGVDIAIASGRAWDLLREINAQLGVVRYGVLSNGAAVLDAKTGEWLYRKSIPEEPRRRAVSLLLEWGIPFEVYCDGENYIQRDRKQETVSRALSQAFRHILETRSHFPEDLNRALDGKAVEKIHLFHVPEERRTDLLNRLEEFGSFAVTSSFGQNMELTALGVNKCTAVQALCARLGLGPEQVMAFGDAGNDLELLAWANWSFAMGNATDEAKQTARFLTGTNHEAGVGMAVEQYVLNL
ncbi:HAD family hydrolase [Flavonifractor hominis]|uniref:HAD family hydrolase n=1 Tax=Flavonifractor hominis TaxID=3133178 RepID=A0ABV1EL60_9FIRM